MMMTMIFNKYILFIKMTTSHNSNYSRSDGIRLNNSSNYSYSAEQQFLHIRYSPTYYNIKCCQILVVISIHRTTVT